MNDNKKTILTKEDVAKSSIHTNIYFAIRETKHRNFNIDNEQSLKENKAIKEVLTECANELLEQSDVSEKNIDVFAQLMNCLTDNVFQAIVVCVLEDKIVNLDGNGNSILDTNNWNLKNMELLENFYKDEEVRFLYINGELQLDVDSVEPFEEYVRRQTAKRSEGDNYIYVKK